MIWLRLLVSSFLCELPVHLSLVVHHVTLNGLRNTFGSPQERIGLHNRIVKAVAKIARGPRKVRGLEPHLLPRSLDEMVDTDVAPTGTGMTRNRNNTTISCSGRRGDILLSHISSVDDEAWQAQVQDAAKRDVHDDMATTIPRACEEDIHRIISRLSNSEVLDIRVMNFWQPSNLPASSTPQGITPASVDAALAKAERVKIRSYSPNVLGYNLRRLNAKFIPVCVTPMGVLGKATHEFIESLTTTVQARRRGPRSGSNWRHYVRRTLSSEIFQHTITTYRTWEAKALAQRTRREPPSAPSNRSPTTSPSPAGGGVDSSGGRS